MRIWHEFRLKLTGDENSNNEVVVKKSIFLILVMLAFNANAALISLGSYTYEDYQFADSTILTIGASIKDPSNASGQDFDSFVALNATNALNVVFSDNFLLNGTGFDIVVFELAALEVPSLSLSVDGGLISGTLLERVRDFPGARYIINVFGFDLSDLGIASGDLYADSLFLRTATPGNEPDIAAIAAVNGGRLVNNVEVSEPKNLLMLSLFLFSVVVARKRFL